MSTLHERLLAELDKPWEIWAAGEPARALGKQRLALRAVVELHAPRERVLLRGLPSECTVIECTGCLDDGPAWPCSTIQAIARELGVPTEGDDRG